MLGRHIGHKVSVKQALAAFKESDWVISDDLVQLINDRIHGVISTIACEEMIGVSKNSKPTKAARKFRRPETCTMERQ